VNANSPDAPFVLSPGGIQVFKDNNGNYISSNVVNSSETDWTDTAGHLALKVIIGSTTDQFEWQDTTGTYQTTTMKLQSYSVKTNFGCSGVVEYTGTVSLPYEIDLPNGQKYSFTYEATPGNTGYVTGRLQRVTLPTGGYYEYDYSGSNDGINCSDGTVLNMSRTINDGTTSSTEQYARTLNGSSGWFTTVTEPQMPYDTAANQSVYTFNTSGQETSHKTYQGSASGGTLLHTVNTTWALNGSPATRITILENNNTQSEVEMTYDSYGNLQTTKQHDCDLPPVSAQFMIRLLVTCPLFPHSS
jgi:hypothetical protein